MRMRRWIAGCLCLLFVAASVLSANGQPQPLKVAILLPGPYNDHGWNEVGYSGLMAIKEHVGAQVAYTENVQQSDEAADFRGYAAQGYTLVFGHGFQFADAAKQVAPEFPHTWFVVTSTVAGQAPNVASMSVDNYQQGYLAGAAAALLSKTGIVGTVGGQPIPPITNALKGFEAGAKHVNPAVQVLSGFTESFSDVAKAKEFALAMIDKGADVVMGDANQAGIGVVGAARDRHVLAIGMNSDQHSLAPETIPISVIQNYAAGFVAVAKKVLDGSLQPGPLNAGLNEGAVYPSPWYGPIPDQVQRSFQDVLDQAKAGQLPRPR